jgi:hypothetical protein
MVIRGSIAPVCSTRQQKPALRIQRKRKDRPLVIGFSSAGLGESWRVVMLHSLEALIL